MAAALKMYQHFENWPKKYPLCVHAEGHVTATVVVLASRYNRPVHICHVARKEEIEIIRAAKESGLNVTCEVSPHHLFLTQDDSVRIGAARSEVRPILGTPEDQQALWDNMDIIDCFASKKKMARNHLLVTQVSRQFFHFS
uniref:CAD_1 protein n=1 Tax=Fopius arisanus TaxID=64838 RepID=A0A0C9QD66_9HYME